MAERAEHEARFLVRDIPAEARIVALLHAAWPGGGEAARSARAADGIATGLARRREHTLLASCEPGVSPLDELLAGGRRKGLGAALTGEARLSDIAVRRADRPFVYLPFGDSSAPPSDLLGGAAFRRFVHRVRERGGTLLLHLPEEAFATAAVRELFDGYVVLGELAGPLPPATETPELGRLVFGPEAAEGPAGPEEEPGGPAAEADRDAAELDPGTDAADLKPGADAAELELDTDPADLVPGTEAAEREPAWVADAAQVEVPDVEPAASAASHSGPPPGVEPQLVRPDTWQRHRARNRPPLRRILMGAVVIGAIVVSWWLFARGTVQPPGDLARTTPTEMASPGIDPGSPDGGSPPVEWTVADLEAAPQLAYSVLLASFAARSDAEERLAELRAEAGGLFFIAPTPVRGAVYHRVFAGAQAGRSAAFDFMESLVESGHKETASPWHVRPARLAFWLGSFRGREGAEALLGSTREVGIPAYMLPALISRAPAGRDTVFVVYAGAYESERAAQPLAELLERVGWEGELVLRRGEAR